ncbi:hypothetical protein AAC03nite_13080 [Alicyclobacillus acidoterrestris]|nr:hypothetical protein AAC03nite_13080 [Alicyclobacillus acidoterrestris]
MPHSLSWDIGVVNFRELFSELYKTAMKSEATAMIIKISPVSRSLLSNPKLEWLTQPLLQ